MNTTIATTVLDAYRRAGTTMATVYLPSTSAVADADQRLDTRRRQAVSALGDEGAPESLMAVVDAALSARSHDDGVGVVLVATASEVIFTHETLRPVDRVEVALGVTPRLLPLLSATRADVDHVAVLIDRRGADMWTRSDLGPADEKRQVEGDLLHVQRSHPGGWSQRRFQQRAENTWESNARLVVDEVLALLPEGVGAVVVGGDVRARGFFTEHFPSWVTLIEVDGSRAADAGAFLDRVDTAIRSEVARGLAVEIEEMRDAIGEGRGAAGDEVLDLLTQGRVAWLFVADDTFDTDRRQARFDFSVPRYGGPAEGDDGPEPDTVEPLTDGAVALAVATGADVVVMPATGSGGIDGPLAAELRG